MRVYYLRLVPADFSVVGNVWTSDVIDLYDNSIYKNYSVTRSNYGTAALNTTWVGMQRASDLISTDFTFFTPTELSEQNWVSDFATDTGKIVGGRYIDTSGRVDLVSFSADGAPSLRIFTSETSDDTFYEDEWQYKELGSPAEEIAIIDSDRYAKLEFTFSGDLATEIFLRVEVDVPVMTPLYRMSRQLLDQFPEWMALRANLPLDSATPELATPTSIGGSFLNSIAGEWLDDIRKELTYRDFQKYIRTVDLEQMAWCYKSSFIPERVWSVVGDGVALALAASWEEFVEAAGDDVCFIDYNDRILYSAKEYTTLELNGTAFSQEPHQVPNYLDEIGLFVDLHRLPLEGNEVYQKRIQDVYQNRGGVGVESLKLALRREMNIWKVYGATPDSDYEGATPEILEMEDLEKESKYFDPDGIPTKAFVTLVEQLSREYPTTWGRFVWNKAVWDVGGEDHSGYGVVPYRYDPATPSDEHFQSGVGDGDDLLVFRPDVVTGPREFTGNLKVRGRHKVVRDEYAAVEFDCFIRGKGDRDFYENPEKTVWFTIEILTTGATPGTYYHSFQLTAKADVDLDQATPSYESVVYYEFLADDGSSTDPEIEFKNTLDDLLYGTDGVILADDIDTITLKQGNLVSGVYQDIESEDHFEAWFSHQLGQLLTFDSATDPSYGWNNADATPYLPVASVAMKSLHVVGPTPGTWYSDSFPYKIKLNGVEPFDAAFPLELDIPEILWDSNVTNRSIDLQLETTDSFLEPATPGYGALTRDDAGDSVFLPDSLILVDGDGTWVDGLKSFADSTTSITLSTGTSSGLYPIVTSSWELFENAQTSTFSGTADEFGPWRNNIPPAPGNKNYLFTVLESLTRDDFSVPHSSDYIITWIGVENNNSRVLTWLETNTVKPFDVDDNLEYPENSVVESLSGGVYSFDPIRVMARIRPDPDPQWYPQIHSGYFYDHNDEYYFYADKATADTSIDQLVLPEVARQGAPIIAWTDEATPRELRQVAFFDPAATPVSLSLENTETVSGTGLAKLYLSWSNVYGVSVVDEDGATVSADTSTLSHELTTASATDKDKEYTVTYTVSGSFYANNDYLESDGTRRTQLVFDATPSGGASTYTVTYEASNFDPATPVDLPLNTMYTIQDEGFIFISHNEYTLDSIRVRMSPAKLLADGVDYSLVTLQSLDQHGNPKPNQSFTLSTDFGSLDKTAITTDRDGFAVALLTSSSSYSSDTGTLTITGGVNATITFEIEEADLLDPELYAVPKSERIQADGVSQNVIYGKVIGTDLQPESGITVSWKKARSIYELFTLATPAIEEGSVTTNTEGAFVIGPMTAATPASAGYWFVAAEATVDTVPVGDVVFWQEYPTSSLGVENTEGLPQLPVQMATPPSETPDYADGVKHPVKYYEPATLEEATPTINWLPPTWYGISAYRQHQMGIDSHEKYRPT